jgi:3-dehydroquinate synthase
MARVINTDQYPVYINDDRALAEQIALIAPSKVFVLVDETTEQICLYQVLEILPQNSIIIHIDQGEVFKSINTASFIWKSLLHNGADRHALLINLGGGVIGDMGGFCASTYMRGIKFIQMPTTLLSQVDSSIGSKLGVDFENIKNIIGVFQHPQAVIVNTSFLKSLPYKQLLSGYAEIIKHALIADRELWHELETVNDLRSLVFEDLIFKNIHIKNTIVTEDPKEAGSRKILNFGHTIGHALESLLLGSEEQLLHGEAIAIGIVCESYLSYLKGFITIQQCTTIKKLIINLFGHKYKSLPPSNEIIKIMLLDKKNKDKKILFSLLESIGKGNYDQQMTDVQINESLEWYKK